MGKLCYIVVWISMSTHQGNLNLTDASFRSRKEKGKERETERQKMTGGQGDRERQGGKERKIYIKCLKTAPEAYKKKIFRSTERWVSGIWSITFPFFCAFPCWPNMTGGQIDKDFLSPQVPIDWSQEGLSTSYCSLPLSWVHLCSKQVLQRSSRRLQKSRPPCPV